MLFMLKQLSAKGILFYFRDGEKPVHKITMAVLAVILLITLFLLNLDYFIAAAAATLISTVFALTAQKLLGGINGDIIGAFIIITEALAYLILSLIII